MVATLKGHNARHVDNGTQLVGLEFTPQDLKNELMDKLESKWLSPAQRTVRSKEEWRGGLD